MSDKASGDPFKIMKPYQPRCFVGENVDLGDWSALEPLFDELEQDIARPETDLLEWLKKAGELSDAISEEGTRRHVRKDCDTENPELRKAYEHFLTQVSPRAEQRSHALDLLYLEHPKRASLPEDYAVFDKVQVNQAEIFRAENLPLSTEARKLAMDYSALCGRQSAEFEGEQHTLARLGVVLEDTDRHRRRAAFETIAERRKEDREDVENIFDSLVRVRHRIALNAGFENYRDYVFRLYNRFDYTPADCRRLHEVIEETVMPAARRLDEDREARMGEGRLRPWDLNVDPDGRPPLMPCPDTDALVRGCVEVFRRVDPQLGERFQLLADAGAMDLDNREGKAPGGYQVTLAEARFPFIFMNAIGSEGDVRTLLHEGGHAFHTLEARHHVLPFNRHYPIEFAEVASTSMEYMGADHMDVFYQGDDLGRARRTMFERGLALLPRVALVDAFQHWVYENPEHTREERRRVWMDLFERFDTGIVDWSGYEDVLGHGWHRIMHFFHVPLYFIEYGIAGLGAFQVWSNYRQDPAGAVGKYRDALSLGNTRPLPQLFAAAGARLDWSAPAIGNLVNLVVEEIQRLDS